MAEDLYAGFRQYLQEGARLEIGIPLSGGGVFREWAVISQAGPDELLVQISRDVLPANVRIDVGFILDVCVWIKKEAYTCSGIVTERQGARLLRIQLFGGFTLRERRQFFRIAVNLRVKCAVMKDVDRRDVERDWEQRKVLEHMKFQGYDDIVIAAQRARYRPSIELDWQDLPSTEVNLGGGGVRLALPLRLHPDQLVALEVHLPVTPLRVIHAVAQAVHAMPGKEGRDGSLSFSTGLQFVLLDERDRDLIFRHISVTQIANLREIADRRELRVADQPVPERMRWQQVIRRSLWSVLLLLLFLYVVRFLIHYQAAGPENEIQKTYERSIKQYRHEGE